MNVLITGADGFIGSNLCAYLHTFISKKGSAASHLIIDKIDRITRDSTWEQWEQCCKRADFVFHLAGVNRENLGHHYDENEAVAKKLTDCLKRFGNFCPIVFASSIHAELDASCNIAYGRSKRLAEDILRNYSEATGAKVYIYRFPNVFGKWSCPDYNSVIATFCHHIARQKTISNHSPNRQLRLIYIDDLLQEMLCAIEGKPHFDGECCAVPVEYRATVMELEEKIRSYDAMLSSLCFSKTTEGSLDAKLLSTYLSYLPRERLCIPLNAHLDERGSFTEILHYCGFGQISINVTRPLITRGRHWHQSKWELFHVVAGMGVIRMRRVDTNEILSIPVSGENRQVVLIPPGYIHEIENIDQNDDLITLIWANESFDPQRPDTYYEEVRL